MRNLSAKGYDMSGKDADWSAKSSRNSSIIFLRVLFLNSIVHNVLFTVKPLVLLQHHFEEVLAKIGPNASLLKEATVDIQSLQRRIQGQIVTLHHFRHRLNFDSKPVHSRQL